MALIVYSQANCHACGVVKGKLKAAGIEFEEVRIDLNADAKQFVLGNGHRSVPQLYKDGVHVPDYNVLLQNVLVGKEEE